MSTHLSTSSFLTPASIGTQVGAITSWVKIKYDWTNAIGICSVSIDDGYNTSDWDIANPLATYPSFDNTYYNRGQCQLYVGDTTKNAITGFSGQWGGSVPTSRKVYQMDPTIDTSSLGSPRTLWPSTGIVLFDGTMISGNQGYSSTDAVRYAYFVAIRTSL